MCWLMLALVDYRARVDADSDAVAGSTLDYDRAQYWANVTGRRRLSATRVDGSMDVRPTPMLRSRISLAALTLLVGVVLGGYLFSDSQPRSFLAVTKCDSCYEPSDLAGLLASVGIQKAAAAPIAVKETDRCLAIEHPFRKAKYHFIVFPKKDIKDIADVATDDQQYVLDCLAVIRALVVENGLRTYRVETNGPGRQHVTYLHIHLVSWDGHARPRAATDAPQAAHR
jgi:diadenosine tetraphosphate (Ap4A) HIT family hydrolase